MLLQELQLETELGKLQQLLPWPLPPPAALLEYSNREKMFNPIFPFAKGGQMPWKTLSKGGSGVALQPWEVLVEAGVEGKAGEMQVTPGANCMQQIYLEGAEGCASRMSQPFK